MAIKFILLYDHGSLGVRDDAKQLTHRRETMRATFFGLEIGRTGLHTAQFGLDVTSHNISNLDTAGYTRQRIVQTAYDPFASVTRLAPIAQGGLVGGGTRVIILDQIRSAFLDRRFRTESTANAYWETRTQSLSYIESFFDNVNEKTSINYSLAEFFRAMTIVSHDPVSGAPRTLMQTAAMDMVQQFHMIHQGLIDFQKVENLAVVTKTEEINRRAQDMVELNKAIYSFEVTGLIANDLRDKRNLLLDELSRLIDIEYEETPDMFGHSVMKVTIAGETLVDHDKSNELTVGWITNVLDGEDMVAIPIWAKDFRVPWPTSPNNVMPTNPADIAAWEAIRDVVGGINDAKINMDRITGGELKAHIDMRDGIEGGVDSTQRGIPYYIEMMNNLARALVVEINSIHVQGWTDNPSGSETGVLFFEDMGVGEVEFLDTYGNVVPEGHPSVVTARYVVDNALLRNITAKNIKLSDKVSENAFNIAASSVEIGRPIAGVSGESGELQRGNNVNMNRLYALFQKTGISIEIEIDGISIRRDIGSFDEYGTRIRFDVGNTLHTAKQMAETSRILTLAANNQRTAIAGVSLDEEMVHLVKYNHAYNGAARVITQMDDALDRLINGTGRVGL